MQSSLPSAAETALSGRSTDSDLALRCAYYCEENVWRLAYRKVHSRDDHRNGEVFYVAFISNRRKSVPMFHQRASASSSLSYEKPCTWDYHVILIGVLWNEATNECSNPLVFDVDSTLPYPLPLSDYLDASFSAATPEAFAPLFRVVTALSYLEHFGSDRSHMWDTSSQKWNATPPPYQCILPPSSTPFGGVGNGTDAKGFPTTGPTRAGDDCHPPPILSVASNLQDYLNFESTTPSNGCTATGTAVTDALGTILTLPQLRERFYSF